MIYDAFIYNGEIELLEIRRHELSLCDDEVVHIVVEANKTHSGWDKPLYYLEHFEEFEQYNVAYVKVDNMPIGSSPRKMEEHQRNQIKNALSVFSPKDDDIILISDVDEIPRAKQVNKFKPDMQFAALIQDKYAFFLNQLESFQSWDRARLMTWEYLKTRTPEEVRNSGYDFSIHDAGWHFSWVIDPVRKLESFSHQELNTPQNIERVEAKENIWNEDDFKIVDIDLSYPEYIVKNIDKFKHLIK